MRLILRFRPRLEPLELRVVPADVSAPVILQWFDGSYRTIERRAADIFAAGYGTVYTPPPGRADSGDGSVGYDVYDRFDLGGPGHPTLYGTESGLKAAIGVVHRMGDTWTIDFVANHNGFSDLGTPGFANAGGYPGFLLTSGFDVDGDFHGAFEGGDTHGRLAGLIDIAQEKNYQFIRSPVDPNNPNNLPPGTTSAFGRLANVADPNNRRFYPDTALDPILVFDPLTGESNIAIYPFNTATPLAGDPVMENAMGYLMRNAQWLIQAIGVDGLRLDAAKHFDRFVLGYLDRAVYRSNPRLLLDGSQANPFLFSEVFDGDKGFLQTFIRKDIDPNDPGRVGGNRDVLDFPLFFALQSNLSSNGLQNDWQNVVNASIDSQDDGLANNGSQGVAFVSSHDSFGADLSTVAYAYTLMRPGNALVYLNGEEFGDRDFPKDGRGDALGGLYGDAITRLVDIRNTHGRGNYIERWLEKELLAYERENSALVLLSNRTDAGFDSRTIQTSFAPGTPLIELTGNAADPAADPFDDIPELLTVNVDGTVNARFLRNMAPGTSNFTGKGYLVYGLAGPQGSLSLTSVSQTIAGETPTGATNGTARLSSIDVITGASFQVQLSTNAVNLLGVVRDRDADGDNAVFRLDDGLDFNGNSDVDYVQPGSVVYGFEEFTDTHSPGYFSGDGNGQYSQRIDTTSLSEGMHFVTVRAFRHRDDGGPAVFTDFRRSIYVDRLTAVSAVDSFNPVAAGVNENRRATIRSVDLTADNVHLFLDLPAALTDAQVIAMIGAGSQANQIDRDLWTKDFGGLTSGNHALTVVSYEMSGRASVQRFGGQFTSTIFGAGLGDLNFDGQYTVADVTLFSQVLNSHDAQFNPAADFDGDGHIDNRDLVRLHDRLLAVGANGATLAAYEALLGPQAGGYATAEGSIVTLNVTRPNGTTPALRCDWDLDRDGQFDDASGVDPTLTWNDLEAAGIHDNGTFNISLRVTADGYSTTFGSTLFVANAPPTADALASNGPKFERQLVTFTIQSPFDPSSVDRTSLKFSFDFNNDGDFTDSGEILDGSAAAVQHAFTHEGTFTVHARIRDKDGGVDDLTTQVTINNADVIAAGTGAGVTGQVRVLDSVSGAVKFTLTPFGATFKGGVAVATGDLTGDKIPDIVTGTASGGRTSVKVFDGATQAEIGARGFEAFPGTRADGVSVAAGDVNGDGLADIVVGAGPLGPSLVKIISSANGSLLATLTPYPGVLYGVRVSVGDVTGDGKAEVIVAPASGPYPVRIYDGATYKLTRSFFPFGSFSGGLYVAAGDLDGDGKAELIVGQDRVSRAKVRTYDYATGRLLREVDPYADKPTPPAGVRVAAVDANGDGKLDIVIAPARGRSRIRVLRAPDFLRLREDSPFGDDFLGGVFVG